MSLSDTATQRSPFEVDTKVTVGISSCLIGQNVRFNGGHTQSKLCLYTLSEHFDFVPFCPEVAAGFKIPRPAMRLIGDPEQPTLVYSDDASQDLSAQIKRVSADEMSNIASLDGYILMKNSPSCGLSRVKVYQPSGHPHPAGGRGLFASALCERYPNLPIEEEGCLHDDRLLDNFLLRVYAHHHFRREVLQAPSMHNLIKFHSSYKYLLMAHCQKSYRSLGKLLGQAISADLQGLIDTYFSTFMAAIAKPASRKNNCNALLHLLGYLKRDVPGSARQSIQHTILSYRRGGIPLSAPLALLRHYIEQYGSDYAKAQRYLMPYPPSMHPIGKYPC
ncbi:MAG: YbgA family protein [Pseudomonadales bacterium]